MESSWPRCASSGCRSTTSTCRRTTSCWWRTRWAPLSSGSASTRATSARSTSATGGGRPGTARGAQRSRGSRQGNTGLHGKLGFILLAWTIPLLNHYKDRLKGVAVLISTTQTDRDIKFSQPEKSLLAEPCKCLWIVPVACLSVSGCMAMTRPGLGWAR